MDLVFSKGVQFFNEKNKLMLFWGNLYHHQKG